MVEGRQQAIGAVVAMAVCSWPFSCCSPSSPDMDTLKEETSSTSPKPRSAMYSAGSVLQAFGPGPAKQVWASQKGSCAAVAPSDKSPGKRRHETRRRGWAACSVTPMPWHLLLHRMAAPT